MTFHRPVTHTRPTAPSQATPSSPTNVRALGSSLSESTQAGTISYAAQLRTRGYDIGSGIAPIGTERASPHRATQTKHYEGNGDRVDEGGLDGYPADGVNQHSPPFEMLGDADFQARHVFQDLRFLNNQSSTPHTLTSHLQPHIHDVLLPQHPSYTEDIAQYLKNQQDEIALRHAEDLAAGRAEPSGEGGFFPAPGPTDPSNSTVFVGGLHHNVTEPELFKFFHPFGQISYVKIPPGKGCGFVQYVEKRCAELALGRMQGFMLNGCKIRLSWGKTGTDKATKMQDAHLRAISALQGVGSMTPEYLSKLAMAIEIVNDEPLFSQIMTIHNMLTQQHVKTPLDGTSTGHMLPPASEPRLDRISDRFTNSPGSIAWLSSTSNAFTPFRHQGLPRAHDDPQYGYTPFSSSPSPISTGMKLPVHQTDLPTMVDRLDGEGDTSPKRASTGQSTPAFPSSFSSLPSFDSAPGLSSSSSQSQVNASPGSANGNKFEQAFGMSPSASHALNDTQLFEPFVNGPAPRDYARPYVGNRFQGSLDLGSSVDTLRPRASSIANPPLQDLGSEIGGLHLGRGGNNARSTHLFGSAFSPISPVDHNAAKRR